MVKIRLKRQGNKHRPFYRVVVAHSSAGRDGSFIEIIGTYNPLDKANGTVIKGDRAMHWLLVGAQPTETVGYLLKKVGVLEEFLAQRPTARRNFAYLNKAIAPVTQATAVDSSPAPAASEEASASE